MARSQIVALAALFALAAALILWAGRELTFYADDWTFIQSRLPTDVDVFLEPHNEHLSALPVAVYKLLFATAGLDHEGAFHLAVLVAHLACAGLVFLYARGRVGDLLALVAASLILFLGQAWEILFLTVGIGFVGSLAAGVGMLLLLDKRSVRADASASMLLAVALSSSSLGLSFAAGALVEVLWDKDRLRRVWIVAAPLAAYAVWFLAYGEDITRNADLLDSLVFVARLAASAAGGLTGVALVSEHVKGSAGWLVEVEHLLALGAALVVARMVVLRGLSARVAMLLTTLLTFWFALALARAGGEGGFRAEVDPYSPRYVYPSVVLLVLLGVELTRGRRIGARTRRGLALAAAAVSLANVGWLIVSTNDLRRQAVTTRAELGAVEVMRDVVRSSFVPSHETRDNTVLAGPYLHAVGRLDSSPAATAAEIARAPESARLAADGVMIRTQEIRWLGPPPPDTAGAAAPRVMRATPPIRIDGACLSLGGSRGPWAMVIRLPVSGVALTEPPPSPVEVRFRRFAVRFPASPAGTLARAVTVRPLRGRARREWYVRLSSTRRFTVCGVPRR